MITCTRRIQFAAGHRVFGHESKCANLHGHNYVAFFEAEAPELDKLGRVIDFSVLKERLGAWIDVNWDHGMIIFRGDTLATWLVSIKGKTWVAPFNPTAEEMAKYLLNEVGPQQLKGTEVRLVKVTLWETENCYATVIL